MIDPSHRTQIGEAAKRAAAPARKAREGAPHPETPAGDVVESLDRQLASAEARTSLAADRTVLAAERSYAAWVRTGIAALVSGAAAKPLLESRWAHWTLLFTSTALLAFAVLCFVAGVWRELQPAAAPPAPGVRRLPAWALVSANAALGVAAGAALVEVWTARRG